MPADAKGFASWLPRRRWRAPVVRVLWLKGDEGSLAEGLSRAWPTPACPHSLEGRALSIRLLSPSARASRLEDLRSLLAKMREAASLLDPLVRELEFLYAEACNAVNDLGRLDPDRERLMLSAGDAAFAVRAWLDRLQQLLDALEV